MENVGMLVHRGLREVLGSLSEIGYNAEWQDIRASDMGAPHRRERIWIIAYPNTTSDRREWSGENATIEKGLQPRSGNSGELESRFEGLCQDMANTESGESWEQAEWERRESISRGSKEVPYSDSAGLQAAWAKQPAARITGNDTQFSDTTVERLEREEPERRDGGESGLFAECDRGDWATEPAVGRLATGVSGRVDRLKGLGNAIVPQIAELLFNQIKNYNSHRTCETERASNGI